MATPEIPGLSFRAGARRMNTDRVPAYPRVLEELLSSACHVVKQHAKSPVAADNGRLKFRLRRCVAQTAPLGPRDYRWPCVRAEHAPRPLRARPRC